MKPIIRSLRWAPPTLFAFALSSTAACVEPFGGSNLQMTLSGSVHVPGLPAEFGRPPPGTHYAYYAVKHGPNVDTDPTDTSVFHVVDFAIQPIVNVSSPCLIEDDESKFRGLHVTQLVRKLKAVTGIDDPFDPPAGASEGDVIDILTAEVRVGNLGLLQSSVKAITTFSPATYPAEDFVSTGVTCTLDTDCNAAGGERCRAGSCERPRCATESGHDPGRIPPAFCIDDESNGKRRELCRETWAAHPDLYEGNDKVFTLPANGRYAGAADGRDPRNNQFLGGAAFFVETNLAGIDALLLNWQYNCEVNDYETNGPTGCQPLFPDELPEAERSPIGFHYMAGEPIVKTRGVVNFPLANRTFAQLNGEAVVFVDLDNDDVHF